jgi:hypothetical protein
MSDSADMPPYRYIEEAERLLREADSDVSQNMMQRTGEYKTDLLLTALVNIGIAMAKMQGRGRAG